MICYQKDPQRVKCGSLQKLTLKPNLTFQTECEHQPAAVGGPPSHPCLLLLRWRVLDSPSPPRPSRRPLHPPRLLREVSNVRASRYGQPALVGQIVQLPLR